MSVHAIFLYKKTVRATQNRGEETTVYRISFFAAWGKSMLFCFEYIGEICLRNRSTLRFDFLHSFMVCAQTYAFLVQG